MLPIKSAPHSQRERGLVVKTSEMQAFSDEVFWWIQNILLITCPTFADRLVATTRLFALRPPQLFVALVDPLQWIVFCGGVG